MIEYIHSILNGIGQSVIWINQFIHVDKDTKQLVKTYTLTNINNNIITFYKTQAKVHVLTTGYLRMQYSLKITQADLYQNCSNMANFMQINGSAG